MVVEVLHHNMVPVVVEVEPEQGGLLVSMVQQLERMAEILLFKVQPTEIRWGGVEPGEGIGM